MATIKEQIQKELKSYYPGCKTYIKKDRDHFHVRIVHSSFHHLFKDIQEVLQVVGFVKRTHKYLVTVEPVSPELWATRRW